MRHESKVVRETFGGLHIQSRPRERGVTEGFGQALVSCRSRLWMPSVTTMMDSTSAAWPESGFSLFPRATSESGSGGYLRRRNAEPRPPQSLLFGNAALPAAPWGQSSSESPDWISSFAASARDMMKTTHGLPRVVRGLRIAKRYNSGCGRIFIIGSNHLI